MKRLLTSALVAGLGVAGLVVGPAHAGGVGADCEPQGDPAGDTVIVGVPEDPTASSGAISAGYGDDDGCFNARDKAFVQVQYDLSDPEDPEADACGGGSGSHGTCGVAYLRGNDVPIP